MQQNLLSEIQLSDREREILQFISNGLSSAEIAERLCFGKHRGVPSQKALSETRSAQCCAPRWKGLQNETTLYRQRAVVTTNHLNSVL